MSGRSIDISEGAITPRSASRVTGDDGETVLVWRGAEPTR